MERDLTSVDSGSLLTSTIPVSDCYYFQEPDEDETGCSCAGYVAFCSLSPAKTAELLLLPRRHCRMHTRSQRLFPTLLSLRLLRR